MVGHVLSSTKDSWQDGRAMKQLDQGNPHPVEITCTPPNFPQHGSGRFSILAFPSAFDLAGTIQQGQLSNLAIKILWSEGYTVIHEQEVLTGDPSALQRLYI